MGYLILKYWIELPDRTTIPFRRRKHLTTKKSIEKYRDQLKLYHKVEYVYFYIKTKQR